MQLKTNSSFPLRAALVLIYGLCLAAIDFPYWPYAGLYILGATFIPYDRVRTVAALNIVFFLVTGGLLSITSPAVGSEVQFQQASLITVLASASLIAVIYFILFQLMSRIKNLRYPLAACLLLVVMVGIGLVTLGETLFKIPPLNYIAISLFLAAIRVFWSFCYQLSEVDTLRSRPFWEHLGTLAFPWQFGWASPNIVRGYSDLRNEVPADDTEFTKAQVSGVKLMLCALVTQLAANKLAELVFSTTDRGGEVFISPLSQWLGVDFSTTSYLELQLSRPLSWLFIFLTAIHFLLALMATTNAAVSMARMCGFMVFRHVYRPLQATSFNNFLGRMYYYYMAILLRFIFYPLWRVLRPVKMKRLRIFLTHFGTILGGGFLTTALRYAPFTYSYNFLPLTDLVLFRWPYFVALATISGLSALLPSWKALGPARGVFYFTIYTLCFSLQIRYWDSTTGDAWRAFLHLFYL